jgi:S-(hydroxymethyl)glutathione dehydrogenase/alcohol dehydrogenase
MKIKAAILWERGQPLSIEDAELDPPGAGEILVEIMAAGVCHSDLHPARDDWPMRTPLVLGHEGAGIVREVGAGVTRVSPDDHVVLCWAPACGVCPSCAAGLAVLCDRLDRTTYRNRLPSGAARLHARGHDLGQFLGTACFAEFAIVAEEAAVVVERELPFDALATIGCAVVTGVGAVLTAARVPPGARIAVVGAGGVGLNVVQGAVIAAAERIIAVDRRPTPLGLARDFGATDVIDAAELEAQTSTSERKSGSTGTGASRPVAEAIRGLTGGRGADFVFDTVGTSDTLTVSLEAARKGGTVVLTGLSRIDAVAAISTFPFVMQEKRLVGSVYGSGRPTEDIQRLVKWHREGRLKLKELVRRTYSLDQINAALSALAGAEGARGVVLR